MAQVSFFHERNSDTNSLVTITVPADPSRIHYVREILASFSLGGNTEEVVVTINAVEFFRAAVDTGDSVRWTFDGLTSGNPNEELVVTLDAGGALNIGTLVVKGRTA